jgi:tetratricopeptide (TPR) repeat protein
MSPRTRVIVIAGAAAALAAGGTVAVAVVTGGDKDTAQQPQQAQRPLAGAPPLVLDLGVRIDSEARALRRAERLYSQKRSQAAGRIFARYRSPQAQVGAVFSAWPDTSRIRSLSPEAAQDALEPLLAKLEQLALERRDDSLVYLHLGFARLWAGRTAEATTAWREAAQAQPDSASAQRADTALHPNFPPGQPFFVPSFPPPAGLDELSPPAQLAALARDARQPDVHAKLLYGLALQRLGHRLSAQQQYDAAARLAPRDPEALVAAAVARFDKSRPAEAFSRLGPLTRRFPKAATVRFHLGVLLLWLARSQPGSVEEGKRQLRLAQADSGSRLARQATMLLARLGSPPKK